MRIYEHRDDYDLSKYDGNFRSITAADRAAHEAKNQPDDIRLLIRLTAGKS